MKGSNTEESMPMIGGSGSSFSPLAVALLAAPSPPDKLAATSASFSLFSASSFSLSYLAGAGAGAGGWGALGEVR